MGERVEEEGGRGELRTQGGGTGRDGRRGGVGRGGTREKLAIQSPLRARGRF